MRKHLFNNFTCDVGVVDFQRATVRNPVFNLRELFLLEVVKHRNAQRFERGSVAVLFVLILHRHHHQLLVEVECLGGSFKAGTAKNTSTLGQASYKGIVLNRLHKDVTLMVVRPRMFRKYVPLDIGYLCQALNNLLVTVSGVGILCSVPGAVPRPGESADESPG